MPLYICLCTINHVKEIYQTMVFLLLAFELKKTVEISKRVILSCHTHFKTMFL